MQRRVGQEKSNKNNRGIYVWGGGALGAGHIGDLRRLLVCVFGQCTWTQSDIDRVAAATAAATACKTGNWKLRPASD